MYEELVKRLRYCSEEQSGCGLCALSSDCVLRVGLLTQAADAIAELVRKEKFHTFLWNTIQPNEMEQYLAMYRSQAVPSQPPKEEI